MNKPTNMSSLLGRRESKILETGSFDNDYLIHLADDQNHRLIIKILYD